MEVLKSILASSFLSLLEEADWLWTWAFGLFESTFFSEVQLDSHKSLMLKILEEQQLYWYLHCVWWRQIAGQWRPHEERWWEGGWSAWRRSASAFCGLFKCEMNFGLGVCRRSRLMTVFILAVVLSGVNPQNLLEAKHSLKTYNIVWLELYKVAAGGHAMMYDVTTVQSTLLESLCCIHCIETYIISGKRYNLCHTSHIHVSIPFRLRANLI